MSNTVQIPRNVLHQLHLLTNGATDIKIMKYRAKIEQIAKNDAWSSNIAVSTAEVDEAYKNVCDQAKAILKPYTTQDEYYDFGEDMYIDNESHEIFIGVEAAPSGLENKCILVENHLEVIVEKHPLKSRLTVIKFKKKK